MHHKIRLWFDLFFGGLLLFLFLVPRAYLKSTCDGLLAHGDRAAALLETAEPVDEAAVTRELAAMDALYQERAPVLRLFLHHGEVDALGTAIAALTPLTEKADILSGLNAAALAADHLSAIETCGWDGVF